MQARQTVADAIQAVAEAKAEVRRREFAVKLARRAVEALRKK